MALAYSFGTLTIQISLVGSFVSLLAGILLALMKEVESTARHVHLALSGLTASRSVMSVRELRAAWEVIASAMQNVAESESTLFRQLATERIRAMHREAERMSNSELMYVSTEAWRHAYADVLNQEDVKEYRSVAWIRSLNYWQDQPGQQSLNLNYELVSRGMSVTRLIILRSSEVCGENGTILQPIRDWIENQHEAGIRILLVPEESLDNEKGLLIDVGLYGSTAVGILDANQASETICFRLSFDEQDVRQYLEKWERLLLFAREWRSDDGH